MKEKLDKQATNKPLRNEKGQLLPGQTANPNGRPKGKTLKEYVREKLAEMLPEDREEFLKTIPKETIWKMAEGNPTNDVQVGATDDLKEFILKYNAKLG